MIDEERIQECAPGIEELADTYFYDWFREFREEKKNAQRIYDVTQMGSIFELKRLMLEAFHLGRRYR